MLPVLSLRRVRANDSGPWVWAWWEAAKDDWLRDAFGAREEFLSERDADRYIERRFTP